MGFVVFGLSLPSSADSVAYVLLLCFGVWRHQNGIRAVHWYELRNIPQVSLFALCSSHTWGQELNLPALYNDNVFIYRAVVPIGACYAGTLWLGNAAYLYLSVSFIQMLKVCTQLSAMNAAPDFVPLNAYQAALYLTWHWGAFAAGTDACCCFCCGLRIQNRKVQ